MLLYLLRFGWDYGTDFLLKIIDVVVAKYLGREGERTKRFVKRVVTSEDVECVL